jgi:anthraniloyl-CoA monooxygenase
VRSARTAAAASAAGLLLQGSDDRPAVLDRLDIAERVRSATGLPTLASVPADLVDDAAAALVSARLDAVVHSGGPTRTS